MSENVFLETGDVKVTTARFISQGQTYAMSQITSVKASKKTPSRVGPILFILVGIIFQIFSSTVAFGALALIGGGIAWLILQKPSYVIILNSASGETEALLSKDGTYIKNVVDAINNAIIERG